jgi:hypothetical protein
MFDSAGNRCGDVRTAGPGISSCGSADSASVTAQNGKNNLRYLTDEVDKPADVRGYRRAEDGRRKDL